MVEQAGKRRPTPEQAGWLHSFFGVDISKYADEAEAGVSQAGHTVAQGASAAVGVVEQKASEAGHAIAHGAEVAKDGVVHVAEEAGEAIEEAIKKAVAFMKEVGAVVGELMTEIKHLASIAAHDMGQCPAECLGIATATTGALATGATCIGAVFTSATPAAPVAVPVAVASALGFLTSIGGLILAAINFDKCLTTAVDTKKKQSEDRARDAQQKQQQKEEDDHYQLIMEELKRLESQRTDVQSSRQRIQAHEQRLRDLIRGAPSRETASHNR